MSKNIKFNINLRVNGQDMLVSASVNSKTLAKNLGIVKDQTDRFRSAMLNLNQTTQVLQNFASGIVQISSSLQTYLSAFNAQSEAETKLANNMRNTMAAREEDIQSIKDLCAAQQELGVIGDEIQLAGAQEQARQLVGGDVEELDAHVIGNAAADRLILLRRHMTVEGYAQAVTRLLGGMLVGGVEHRRTAVLLGELIPHVGCAIVDVKGGHGTVGHILRLP